MPQTLTSWEGWLLQATAPSWQPSGPYAFASWSNGSGNPLVVTTPAAPATFTASYQLATDDGPRQLFTVAPCRLVDTRNPAGPRGGPALVAGTERSFDAWGACGVPATAHALAINVTVAGATAQGHVRLWPSDELRSGTSSLNFLAGVTRANNAVLRLSAAGRFSVFCSMASGSADLVVDVTGYFE